MNPSTTSVLILGGCLLIAHTVSIDSAPTGARLTPQTPRTTAQIPPIVAAPEEETAYVCPMHADFTSDTPGACQICGMALVIATPYDVRDYTLTLTTTPAVVKAGEKARLRFAVTHPGSGETVKEFQTVHDRQYHLFVISQDMSVFEHIHPEQQADGAWAIDVVLPKPGYYKLLSDFLPTRGAAQFIARPLVTAGFAGDLASSSARLAPDTTLSKTVDDLTVTVTYQPDRFVAGQYSHLMFYLTDATTGRPVTDLQTYLGAFGHTLIMSEDMMDYVHSHPLELEDFDPELGPRPFMLPPDVDPETLRGGPEVVFEGLMPKSGRYRAWTQFRRHDKIHTVAFTFEATLAPTAP